MNSFELSIVESLARKALRLHQQRRLPRHALIWFRRVFFWDDIPHKQKMQIFERIAGGTAVFMGRKRCIKEFGPEAVQLCPWYLVMTSPFRDTHCESVTRQYMVDLIAPRRATMHLPRRQSVR